MSGGYCAAQHRVSHSPVNAVAMAGLQANVYASISITMTAAVVVLVLRMMARRMTKMRLWFDDYFAVVAFVIWRSICVNDTIANTSRLLRPRIAQLSSSVRQPTSIPGRHG